MPSRVPGIATFASGVLAGLGAGLSLAPGNDPQLQVPLAVTGAAAALSLAAGAALWRTRTRTRLIQVRESTLQAQVAALQERLRQQTTQIDQLARTDPTTGVLNAAAFQAKVDELILHSARCDRPYSILLIQVKRSRSFSGEGSRSREDQVLQTLTRSLASATRGTDLVGRWGDRLFIACLDACRDPQPSIDRFLVGLKEGQGSDDEAVQASVGAAVVERWSPEITLDALLRLAGAALASVGEGTGSRSCRRVFTETVKRAPAAG